MVTTKLNLSMTEPQVRQIYAKQGDTGRVLDIALDQTPEDGTLRILRPDGVEVTSEAVTGGEISESGETVSFESLTEADVTELTVGIEPVQDLNGYDAPWVGGAGVNIIGNFGLRANPLSNNVSATLQADGSSYVLSGTASALADIYLFSASSSNIDVGSYYLYAPTGLNLAGTTADYFYIGIRGSSGTRYVGVGGTVTSRAFTIAEGEYLDRAFIRISSGVDATGKVVTPMIVKGTTAPTSYAPYSNICPITGHDEVAVTRTGKNLLDVSLGQYKALNSTTGEVGADNPIRFTSALTDLSDGTYTFSFGSNMFIIGIAFYDKSGNFKRYEAKNFSTTAQTFSVESEKIRLYCGSAQNHNDLVDGLSVGQLELGSTATAYEPYRSNTYTTSLGQTVYGGTLDMVSGVLTVDKAMVDMGSLSWNENGAISGGKQYATVISDKKVGETNFICSAFATSYPITTLGCICGRATTKTVAANSPLTTLADFVASVTGQTIVYELETPQTYTLTAQQIKTLVGTNNVWASSGDIVSITFTYGSLLSELPSEATEIVGKCYCDIEQNGVSSMPFTLNVKKNERQ